MTRIPQRFHILPWLVVLALIVASTLGVVNWIRMSHVEKTATAGPVSSSYHQVPMEMQERPSALFVGDDFLTWTQGFYTYPYQVCDVFAVNCNVDAQGGTGFLNNGESYSGNNRRLIDRLPKDRGIFNADLIIIDAGRNDFPTEVEAFGGALGEYLAEVRRSWPEANIVVIVPWVMSAEQNPNYAEIASVVRQQTEMVGGVVIDPLEEGWFNDVDISELQMRDTLNPNQAGHTLIGKKLSESLERNGLLERGAKTQ